MDLREIWFAKRRQAGASQRWWRGAAAGAAVAALGGGVTACTSTTTTSATAATGACSVTSMADRVLPSVVTVAVHGPSGSGTGSGEVIKSDGYILTNNHVIAPAASGGSVDVMFSDGTTEPATITGRDPLTDLAVIKVKPSSDLRPIALGSSGTVEVGQQVIAIGSPLGLSGTVTSGIVSAVDRTVQVPAENDKSALLVSAVQTDAAINPGNSGGALVNCDGKLIGVPTAGASVPTSSGGGSSGSIGLGFAIPVDLAKAISTEIIDTGRVKHAYFGLQTVPIPESAAAQAGVSQGLFVAAIAPGGPAARAGLAADDVITSINGKPATSNIQLQELTLMKKPGDTVPIDYVRNGARHSATITLGTQP